ncbi:MAG: RHS repeat-associated core domain-containing protein [Planctomycetes bacterium]|nr:RHS repeat-associated core domain-containing protein [Planctomycetota bacterium]
MKNHNQTSTLISSFVYTHDLVGNRTAMNLNGGDSISYGYDSIYQLTSESRSGSISYTNTWTYDLVGNRKTQVESYITTTNYTHNNNNQLTQESTSTTTYTYALDANGNVVSKSDGTNIWNWSHSYENKVVSYYESLSGNTGLYVHDAYGRRIQKTANGNVEKFVYDGANVIVDYDSGNNLTAKYVTPGLNHNLLVVTNSATYYYFHDGLGSVTDINDSSQITRNAYSYYAFGASLSTTEQVNNRYRFTGQEYNTENGEYDYGARHYNPYTGRFNTRDPIGYGGGVNLYTYVCNNPINRTDSSGMYDEEYGESPAESFWRWFKKQFGGSSGSAKQPLPAIVQPPPMIIKPIPAIVQPKDDPRKQQEELVKKLTGIVTGLLGKETGALKPDVGIDKLKETIEALEKIQKAIAELKDADTTKKKALIKQAAVLAAAIIILVEVTSDEEVPTPPETPEVTPEETTPEDTQPPEESGSNEGVPRPGLKHPADKLPTGGSNPYRAPNEKGVDPDKDFKKNPHGKGFVDEKGKIWVLSKDGTHWDVTDPKTNSHENIKPDGEKHHGK